MILPCIECLKYPICRHKKEIACDDLNSFFNGVKHEMREIEMDKLKIKELNYFHSDEINSAWDNSWEVMFKIFPNIKVIRHNEFINEW